MIAFSRGLASQVEAEAGTNNSKLLTPLRTAQAIAALGGGGGSGPLTINDQSGLGADYTFVLSDAGKLVLAPPGFNLLVPDNASVAFSIGTVIYAYGAAIWYPAAAGSAAISQPESSGGPQPFQFVQFVKLATDEWAFVSAPWNIIHLLHSVTGLIKSDGGGSYSAAIAGTDFAAPTAGAAILKGNGAGGFSDAVAGTDYTVPGTITITAAEAAESITPIADGTYTLPGTLTSGSFTTAKGLITAYTPPSFI